MSHEYAHTVTSQSIHSQFLKCWLDAISDKPQDKQQMQQMEHET